MAKSLITYAEAAALWGQQDAIVSDITYPMRANGISRNPDVEVTNFERNLVALAAGIPLVDEPNYMPPIKFFDDFVTGGFVLDDELTNESNTSGKFCETAENGEWLVTVATVGEAYSIIVSDTGRGGWLTVTTVATQNHPVNCQLNGLPFLLVAGKPLVFEARLVITDVSDGTCFIGLSIAGTDLAQGALGVSDDAVGFFIDVDGTVAAVSSKDGTDTTGAAVATFVDGTIAGAVAGTTDHCHRLGIKWDGVNKLRFYVDGVVVKTIATASLAAADPDYATAAIAAINQDEHMTVAFAADNTAGGNAYAVEIDYIACSQAR